MLLACAPSVGEPPSTYSYTSVSGAKVYTASSDPTSFPPLGASPLLAPLSAAATYPWVGMKGIDEGDNEGWWEPLGPPPRDP